MLYMGDISGVHNRACDEVVFFILSFPYMCCGFDNMTVCLIRFNLVDSLLLVLVVTGSVLADFKAVQVVIHSRKDFFAAVIDGETCNLE